MRKVSEIRSVLVPLLEHSLLLPNACVAEVVSFTEPELSNAVDNSWYKGTISWRSHTIPVVSLDTMLGVSASDAGVQPIRSRIIICNMPGGNEDIPYVGVVAVSIPRLVRVTVENVVAKENVEDILDGAKLVSAVVEINNIEAFIPDLAYIESQVASI